MINKVAGQSMVGDVGKYQQISMIDAMSQGGGAGGSSAAMDMASMSMGMMMGQQMVNQMSQNMQGTANPQAAAPQKGSSRTFRYSISAPPVPLGLQQQTNIRLFSGDIRAQVEAARREKARLVGLSALMTTTVCFMEQTVKMVHEELPGCKVTVGGAVLTREYAERIGADNYSKDAMGLVRYAESLFS